jgi:anti-sigma factor RsiW
MTEHVTAWLGAYHDGELHGRRLRQVEAHLVQCATCRAELESLRSLTELLQASPAAVGIAPPERFVAQVGLRMPRHPAQSPWRRGLEIGWRLAPVGLLGAWAFIEAAFAVASMVLLALRLGAGGDLIAGLLPAGSQAFWLVDVLSLSDAGLPEVGRVALEVWEGGGPLGWGFTLNLLLSAVIGLLYCSWLATWWARRQHQSQSRV